MSASEERLALYKSDYCVFCIRVKRVIEELGISVEMRDVWDEPRWQQELIAARGRATVPVLRLTGPSEDRWMPESVDIIRYLRQRFG